VRNKCKPDGRKKAKDKESKLAEAGNLRDKIDDMMKSKEVLVEKTMQDKMIIANKKLEEKNTRWKVLRESEARRIAFEERRVQVEENKATTELIAEENRIMMLSPIAMDDITRECLEVVVVLRLVAMLLRLPTMLLWLLAMVV
jgi:hypothetical protein